MVKETFSRAYRPIEEAPIGLVTPSKPVSDALQFRVFGFQNETTARILRKSPHTIHTQLGTARENMQAISTTQAALRAVHYGIVDAPKITDFYHDAIDSLSKTEERVGRLLVEDDGKRQSDKEIAIMLGISENTVHTYMRRLYKKLATHDRLHATVILDSAFRIRDRAQSGGRVLQCPRVR